MPTRTLTTDAGATPSATSAPVTGRPGQQTRRAASVRSGFMVAALGLATMLPLYFWIFSLQAADKSAAALSMPEMHMNQMGIFWSFPILQAAGLAALVWSYLSMVLGLAQSGRTLKWFPLTRNQSNMVHRQLSLLVIGLIAIHIVATVFDAMGDNLLSALVPWQASWGQATLAYNLGIFAFYLALLLGPTYYLRKRFGARGWRFAHRFVLAVYILSVWHTLIIGADVAHYGWFRPVIWLAQIPLLTMFARRLLQPAARGDNSAPWTVAVRYVLAAVSLTAAVGVLVLLATGDYVSFVQSIQ